MEFEKIEKLELLEFDELNSFFVNWTFENWKIGHWKSEIDNLKIQIWKFANLDILNLEMCGYLVRGQIL